MVKDFNDQLEVFAGLDEQAQLDFIARLIETGDGEVLKPWVFAALESLEDEGAISEFADHLLCGFLQQDGVTDEDVVKILCFLDLTIAKHVEVVLFEDVDWSVVNPEVGDFRSTRRVIETFVNGVGGKLEKATESQLMGFIYALAAGHGQAESANWASYATRLLVHEGASDAALSHVIVHAWMHSTDYGWDDVDTAAQMLLQRNQQRGVDFLLLMPVIYNRGYICAKTVESIWKILINGNTNGEFEFSPEQLAKVIENDEVPQTGNGYERGDGFTKNAKRLLREQFPRFKLKVYLKPRNVTHSRTFEED